MRRGSTVAALVASLVAAVGAVAAVPTTADAARRPRSGGEIVWGLEAESTGGWCLPQSQLAVSGIIVANAIYDTLMALNADGEYVPVLAQSLTPNATYDQWTLGLRDGVRFHDGSSLDADIVKLNLDTYRGLNPKVPARLTPFVFDNVADVQVTGPLTLSITTKTPWPAFPALLFGGGRYGMMAAAQLDDPATCATNLIGTGPFTKESWRPNEEFVAVKNPDYWRDGLPHLDRITFRPVTDSSARLNQFEGGELDVMHTTNIDNIVALREDAEQGSAQLFESTRGGEVAYMMLNASKAPFDDRLARQAIAYGRNTAEINQIRNRGVPDLATSPFGPGSVGYVADNGFPEPNERRARRLAARYEAKHGTPLAFEYLTNPDPETLAIAQLIKERAARSGIEVSIRTVDQPTLISEALAGSFQSMGFRNHPQSDPDAQYVWWHSGSPVNFGRIDDPEIDRLLDAGRTETDPAVRREIYESLNRRFADQLWNLWSWYTVWAVAAKPDVGAVLGAPLPDGGGRPAFLGGFVPVAGEWRRA
jgi:peptide/nickel transport system substrate-binding protein